MPVIPSTLIFIAAAFFSLNFIVSIIYKQKTGGLEKVAFVLAVFGVAAGFWHVNSQTPLEKLANSAGEVMTDLMLGDCSRARIGATTLHGFTKLSPSLIGADPQIGRIYHGTFEAIKECEANR